MGLLGVKGGAVALATAAVPQPSGCGLPQRSPPPSVERLAHSGSPVGGWEGAPPARQTAISVPVPASWTTEFSSR